jgi:hypothetical protein
MSAWFVYVLSLKDRPTPQIWHTGQITKDQKPVPFLQKYELPDDDLLISQHRFRRDDDGKLKPHPHGERSWIEYLMEKYPYDPAATPPAKTPAPPPSFAPPNVGDSSTQT